MRAFKLKYIIFVLVSFFVSSIYFITTAPTVVFWDVGEFLASAKVLGIPHPPGTPLYIILAKFFTFLPLPLKEIYYLIHKLPAHQDVLRITLIPILTGGLMAGIFYLLFVEIVELFEGEDYHPLWVHVSGIFVALLQSFTYTQWFNSIEAETYTPSNFIALVGVYLAFLWLKNRHKPGSVKFLVLSAYVIMLGTGIHLSVLIGFLAIFFFLVLFERKFFIDEDFWAILGVAVAVIVLWFNSYHIAQIMNIKQGMDNITLFGRNAIPSTNLSMLLEELNNLESTVIRWNVAYVISLILMYWYMYKKNKISISSPYVILFGAFTLLSTIGLFVSSSTYMLVATVISGFAGIVLFFVITGIYRGWKGIAFIAILLAIIVEFWLIARANYLHTYPNVARINEGDPYTWIAFMDVLSRKQYGPTSFFHRRIPFHEQLMVFWTYLSWQFTSKPYYTTAQKTPILYLVLFLMILGFFIHYKGHRKSFYLVFLFFLMSTLGMIFLQNPADVPSLPVNPENRFPDPITGIPRMEVRDREYFYALGYSMIVFYAGFGLLGVMKMLGDAISKIPSLKIYLLGIMKTLKDAISKVPKISSLKKYLLGVMKMLEDAISKIPKISSLKKYLLDVMKTLKDAISKILRISSLKIYLPASLGLAVTLIFVGTVLTHNWKFNDRHRNYIAEDFAYNILSSPRSKIFITEKGDTLRSVIFTNGDNDTFPLWFVQEVLGYRRDDLVIANLSLLNTNSYVRQVKHWGAPMTLSDEDIDKLPVVIPLPKPIERVKAGRKEPKRFLLLRDIAIRDMVAGAVGYKPKSYVNVLSEKGIVKLPSIYLADDETFLKEVVLGKDFKVNIYFSMTTDPDAYYTYESTFIMEGIAWRITNEIQGEAQSPFKKIDLERTSHLLFGNMDPLKYIQEYAKKYRLAGEGIYRYRGIFDRRVYKDPTHLRILRNYITLFGTVAEAYKLSKDYDRALSIYKVIDMLLDEYEYFREGMLDNIFITQRVLTALSIADIYIKQGNYDEAIDILRKFEGSGLRMFVINKLIEAYLMKGDTAQAESLGYQRDTSSK